MRAVIIGNSAASLSAAEAFRRYDRDSDLLLVSQEDGPAYSRVLLPYFLRGSLARERLFFHDEAWYRSLGARTLFGRAVVQVKDRDRAIVLDDGAEMTFDRLLIASGARPCLPAIQNLAGPGIHFLWALEEADRLHREFLPGRKVAFIGSGFVSMQGAWAACSRGMRVSILEVMPRILPRVLDAKGSALLAGAMRKHGVDVRLSVGIERVERLPGGSLQILLACESEPLEADLIVVGAGVRPCLQFLRGTAVRMEEGILVDERMRTTAPDIYAAGDVALGPSVFGEPHASHALWPTAVEQGKVAGANMAGRALAYQGSLNMNVAEMFGLTVASMGRCDGNGKEIYDPDSSRYVKLIFKSGVPIGGVVVGSPEDLAALAAVRPLIRTHRKAQPGPELPFADLHLRLARSHAGRG